MRVLCKLSMMLFTAQTQLQFTRTHTHTPTHPPNHPPHHPDVFKTQTAWPYPSAIGCNSAIVDASFSRLGVEVQFLYFALRLGWRPALSGTVATTLLLVATMFVIDGRVGATLWCGVMLQTAVGSTCAVLCYYSTADARRQFAEDKRSSLAAMRSRQVRKFSSSANKKALR